MTDSKKTKVKELLEQAKLLAVEYKALTGKPLGITGEVAEFTAAELLDLELTNARQEGYDAVKEEVKIQIKGRCIGNNDRSAQVGSIKLDKEWDKVVLVLLDTEMSPLEIYEAYRKEITAALTPPGSNARERGMLSVSKFRQIGKKVWPKKDTCQTRLELSPCLPLPSSAMVAAAL